MSIINEDDLPIVGQVEVTDAVQLPEAEDDKKESDTPIVTAVNVPKGTVVGKSALRYSPNNEANDDSDFLLFPSVDSVTYRNQVIDRLNAYSEPEIERLLETTWGIGTVVGEEYTYRNNDQFDALDRENSQWDHSLSFDGKRIGINRMTPKSAGGQEISGLMAVARLSAAQNIGYPVTVPLYNTGIWVTLRPMMNIDLMNMESRVTSLKAAFGRVTRGRIFSQSDIYLKMPLIDEILNHVEATTAPSADKADLKALIKMTDIQALVWGMACANNPQGHPFAQACSAKPGECTYVARGKVHVPDLFYTDNSLFTEKQLRHMISPTRKMTMDEITAYQTEFLTHGTDAFISEDKLRVELQVPSLAEYEVSGYSWVKDLEMMYESVFGKGVVSKQRDEYIEEQANLAGLRQFSHWVKRFVLLDANGNDDDRIEDRGELVKAIERLSGDRKFSSLYYSNVTRFINQMTASITAVPNFVCPNCKSVQPTDEGRFQHLIPIDMAKLFFTLARLRVSAAMRTSDI